MGLARKLPDLWWVAAAPVFIGIALLFAFVSPYLLTTHPLRDAERRAAAARLERIEHVRHVPVVVADVHYVPSLPNAEATGLGPIRRVGSLRSTERMTLLRSVPWRLTSRRLAPRR